MLAGLGAAAEELVLSTVERVAGGGGDVPVEAVAIEGRAATVLIAAAAAADMCVVGARGKGGFVGLLLGSVTHQCVSPSPCPVLVPRSRRQE